MPKTERDQVSTGIWQRQIKNPNTKMFSGKFSGDELRELGDKVENALAGGGELSVVVFLSKPGTEKTPDSPQGRVALEPDFYNARQGGGGQARQATADW